MVDLRVDDPRVDELVRLGLPAVVVGGPLENRALPAVWHDEAAVDRRGGAVPRARSATAGSRRSRASASSSTRCSGSPRSRARRASSGSRARSSRPTTASSRAPARRASCSRRPSRRRRSSSTATCSPSPGSASRSRWASRVPDDLSIVGWDDSLISQVVHPPLTAITRDIEAYGIAADAAPARGRSTGGATGDVETVARRAHAARQHRTAARLVALISARPAARCGNHALTLNRISDGLPHRHDATLERIPRGAPGTLAAPFGLPVRTRAEASELSAADRVSAPVGVGIRYAGRADGLNGSSRIRELTCVDSPDRKGTRGGSTQCLRTRKGRVVGLGLVALVAIVAVTSLGVRARARSRPSLLASLPRDADALHEREPVVAEHRPQPREELGLRDRPRRASSTRRRSGTTR